MDIGIDHIATYVPGQYLPMRELAAARGVDENKYNIGIGIQEMAVPQPWEDSVVLAANAGARVLREAGVSPGDVGLLIVGTESAEDNAKPTASHVHALLGITAQCRVFDIIHACVGATYGILAAIDWARHRDQKYALVIATDIARYGLNTPGEPTQGAGAVAMLVSKEPRLIKLEELSNFSTSVYDFWKPLDERYPIVKGVYSVQCYLNAAKACFGKVELNRDAAFVYHTPYPRLVEKAHTEIASLLGEAANWRSHYADKVASSTLYPSRVGNTYTASLWLALVSLLETCYEGAKAEGIEPVDAAKRNTGIYLFSYGSGCGAVLMQGELADSWPTMVGAFKVRAALDRRTRVSVAEYERLQDATASPGQADAHTGSLFAFDGVTSDERQYSRTKAV
jgi:hydroxymethylglutaryl-CoA synthase